MNLLEKYRQNIPLNLQKVFGFCSDAACKSDLKIFLVGGLVRDLLLDIKSLDTDITVEGNAIDFAKILEGQYPDICKIKSIHEDFKTAKIIFSIKNEQIEIDLASTRTEFYEYPEALPTLKETGVPLQEDVSRRDFTINTTAMSLNCENFAELIDYTGGYVDLQNKILKILHAESFIDDPTRILRALKFGVRFGFVLDEETAELQTACIKSKIFDNAGSERLKSEFKQTFNLETPEPYEIFLQENIYRLLSPNIKTLELPESKKIYETIQQNKNRIKDTKNIWIIYLAILISALTKEEVASITTKLNITGFETGVIFDVMDILQNESKLEKCRKKSEIYEFFEVYTEEALIAYQTICKNLDFCDKINLYIKELRDIKIVSTGKTLVDIGFIPGPEFGDILRNLLKARIDGEILSDEEEKEGLKRLYIKRNRN